MLSNKAKSVYVIINKKLEINDLEEYEPNYLSVTGFLRIEILQNV